MSRRKAAVGLLISGAGIAGVVAVFLGQNQSLHATVATTSTEGTAPPLTFQPTETTVGGSLDPTTNVRAAPTASGQAQVTSPTVGSPAQTSSPSPAPSTPPASSNVTWKIAGSCSATGSSYTCLISVNASNGLNSGGFVVVYPARGNGPGCRGYGTLADDKVSITGQCQLPLAPDVLAAYTTSLDTKDVSPLASAHVPWSLL
jgi:hypothetical protein